MKENDPEPRGAQKGGEQRQREDRVTVEAIDFFPNSVHCLSLYEGAGQADRSNPLKVQLCCKSIPPGLAKAKKTARSGCVSWAIRVTLSGCKAFLGAHTEMSRAVVPRGEHTHLVHKCNKRIWNILEHSILAQNWKRGGVCSLQTCRRLMQILISMGRKQWVPWMHRRPARNE